LVLINEGAEIDCQNQDGNTPLHFCAKFPNVEIPKCLIAAGAKIRTMNANGQTPLFAASHYRNGEMSSFLSSLKGKGADPAAVEAMIRKYLPSLLPEPETEEEESSEDEDLDPELLNQLMTQIKSLDVRLSKLGGGVDPVQGFNGGLEGMTAKLEDMNDRVELLDANRRMALNGVVVDDDLKTCGGMCCLCGAASQSFCQDCQRMFCMSCLQGEGHIAFHVNLYG
jgi:ankyrin repeat protein